MDTCDLLNVIEAYNQAKSDIYFECSGSNPYNELTESNCYQAWKHGVDEAIFIKCNLERLERKLDRLLIHLGLETY